MFPTLTRKYLTILLTLLCVFFAAARSAIAGVSSFDPSSTMIQRLGRTVWATTESMVFCRYAASSRTGDTIKSFGVPTAVDMART